MSQSRLARLATPSTAASTHESRRSSGRGGVPSRRGRGGGPRPEGDGGGGGGGGGRGGRGGRRQGRRRRVRPVGGRYRCLRRRRHVARVGGSAASSTVTGSGM